MVAPMYDDDPVLPNVPPDAPAQPRIELDYKGRKVVRWRLGTGQYVRRDTTPEEAERVRVKTLEGSRRARGPEIYTEFKVDLVLNDLDLRAEYEALMQRPSTGGKVLQRWLADRGHKVSLGAIRAHRNAFLKRVADIDETARRAEQFARIARRHGSGSLAEATAARYEQLFFTKLFDLSDEEAKKLEMKDWQTMQRVAASMAAARKLVEEMRLEFQARARQVTKELEAALSGKDPGELICDRVRTILGIPLGDGPGDDDPPVAMKADCSPPPAPTASDPPPTDAPEPTLAPPAYAPEKPRAIHPSRDKLKPRHGPFELSGW